eukprot:6031647-Pleurochrysis_carterae.AAC.1
MEPRSAEFVIISLSNTLSDASISATPFNARNTQTTISRMAVGPKPIGIVTEGMARKPPPIAVPAINAAASR